MNLRYAKQFLAALKKLSVSDKNLVIHAIEVFAESPFGPSLRNHGLTGTMTGKRALAVDRDLRIIFTERTNYRDVTLLDVGTHAAVYRT